jgi:cystathionine beta-lyase/cystathionine gamma-synthase
MGRDSVPIVPPIYRGTVYAFDTSDELVAAIGDHHENFSYGRYDNPTVMEFEKAIAYLEGAERGVAFASGMAAITTALVACLPAGGRVVRQHEVYGTTAEFFREIIPRFADEVVTVPGADPDALEQAIREGCDVVYLETPINPTLEIVDLERMSKAARDVGAISLVDNTFSTPLGQRPRDLGIDVSLHSATKYLGGHHDVIAGVLATSDELGERIWNARRILGGILSPGDAFLLLRGLKTLRLRLEHATATAASLANRLARDARVARVGYPGLESHPSHRIAASQMRSFGAMIAIDLNADRGGAERFLNALTVIRRAASLGGNESVAMMPAEVSHAHVPPDERLAMGVTDSLIRLSVGTEPEEDLVADLERGFAALDKVPA